MKEKWWSEEEDDLLLKLKALHGTKWEEISRTFCAQMTKPRSPAQLRNRDIRMKEEAKMKSDGRPPNKCVHCGKPKKGHICVMRMLSLRLH